MDPVTLALINAGSGILGKAVSSSGPAPAPPQRADGYALGGMVDAASPNVFSSGATGGAYGGAFSQSNVDGSNWTVSTGNGKSTGGGRSGGNGGLSPTLTSSQGGVAPASPFFAGSGLTGAIQGNPMVLIGLALLAVYLLKK